MASIVVAGALANKPGNGGEAWVALSWLRGLAEAAHEPVFVEVLEPTFADRDIATAWFHDVTSSFGLAGRSALWCDGEVWGSTRPEVESWLSGADLLVDLSGHLASAEARGDGPAISCAATLFVDLDPGYTQVWHEKGLAALGRHDHYASVGLLVGTSASTTPSTGRSWLPVPPFVVLDDWPVVDGHRGSFTTVSTWRSPYGSLEWDGHTHGSKHHAFRAHHCLPRLAPELDIELAINFDPADEHDRELLSANRFRLTNPATVAGAPDVFRTYVQRSAGEWSVAQGAYVGLRTGWLSDRTVRYLASGRPAVVEDTGVGDVVPVGEGLLVFDSVVDAAVVLQDASADWHRHSLAARTLAEQYFSAEVVLPPVLAACGVAGA